jgi:acyl-CoA dehydrogenase
MTHELYAFWSIFRKFFAKDLSPHADVWRSEKMVERSVWRGLGEMGVLPPSIPETDGGLGAAFAYDAAVLEDIESVVPELYEATRRVQNAADRIPKQRVQAGLAQNRGHDR